MITAYYELKVTNKQGRQYNMVFIDRSLLLNARYKAEQAGMTTETSGHGYSILRTESQIDDYLNHIQG